YGAGHQAASPEWLTEPVAHLRAQPGNVRTQPESNAADRLAAVLHRERSRTIHRPYVVQVIVGVAPAVGMRKLIAQIGCNLRIVGVAQQRAEVVLAPGTNA